MMIIFSKKTSLVLVLSLVIQVVNAQTRISGFVKEFESLEVLVGAHIYNGNGQGAVTDNNGYFSLAFTDAIDTLYISYLGFEKECLNLEFCSDTILDVRLKQSNSIEEVEIISEYHRSGNVATLKRSELISIPSIGAEPDVLKTLQFLPGIQGQNEGSSNLVIRGGEIGQNQYLLDNIPLLYVNHLGGFMSVFNPELINSVKVYKGGFPAKYGGKISSIVDISLREGDNSTTQGSVGVGLTGANASFQGPIGDEITYFLTFRKTFTEPLFRFISAIADQNYTVSYGFYDLNSKLTWNPNLKNKVHLNIYMGDDQWNSKTKSSDDASSGEYKSVWGNKLVGISWKHLFGTRVYQTSSLSYTNYRMRNDLYYHFSDIEESIQYYESKNLSRVQNYTFKSDLRFNHSKYYSIDFGIQSSFLDYIPNQTWNTNDSIIKENGVKTIETAFYMENKLNLNEKVKINLGIRLASYYAENQIAFYPEPRIEISYRSAVLGKFTSSYMLTNQFSNMLVTNGNFVTNEIWIPSVGNVYPSSSSQLTFGWQTYLMEKMFVLEVDAYYKDMNNLSMFKEGYANVIGDANWRDKVVSGGVGKSYGVEFFMRKNKGDIQGFCSYAYNISTRQFQDVNLGNEFPFDYSRPHSFTLNLSKELNDKIKLNLTWIYQSGLPYTPSLGKIWIPNTNSEDDLTYFETLLFGERNSGRMRSYHRLDLGVTYKKLTKRNKIATWSFSIYNAYNRRNGYYYFYNSGPHQNTYWKDNGVSRDLNLYQVSYFPIIPSVSYSITF